MDTPAPETLYTSRVTLDKALTGEMTFSELRNMKIFSIVVIVICIMQLVACAFGTESSKPADGFMLLFTIFMWVIYASLNKSVDLSCKRRLVADGKVEVLYDAVICDDAITSICEGKEHRYTYDMVKSICLTKSMILVGLDARLCIPISKTDISAPPEAVLAYLCARTGIKKARNTANDKTIFLVICIVLTVLCAAAMVMSVVNQFPLTPATPV